MKDWIIIIVLLVIVAILGSFFVFQLNKVKPQKELEQQILAEYEKREDKATIDFDSDYEESELFNKQKNVLGLVNFLSSPLGVILEILLMVIIYIGNIKLYKRVGISSIITNRNFKALGIIILSIILINIIPSHTILTYLIEPIMLVALVSLIVWIVTFIQLEYYLYQALNISFLLFLINLVPAVGVIIVNIIIGIKLSDEFGRGIKFKIALCALPFVFRPVLGFKGYE